MIRKLSLVCAFGAGYVLGAKAGKERYAQITDRVQSFASKPAVQSATEKVQAKATDLSDEAKDKAADLADQAKAKAADTAAAAKDKVSGDAGDEPSGTLQAAPPPPAVGHAGTDLP